MEVQAPLMVIFMLEANLMTIINGHNKVIWVGLMTMCFHILKNQNTKKTEMKLLVENKVLCTYLILLKNILYVKNLLEAPVN